MPVALWNAILALRTLLYCLCTRHLQLMHVSNHNPPCFTTHLGLQALV